MRVRPFFWVLLAASCISVLIFAAKWQAHVPAVMQVHQEIADKLVISIKTVQAHRANVMEKLGLQDITHLVRFAIRHGLIPEEP